MPGGYKPCRSCMRLRDSIPGNLVRERRPFIHLRQLAIGPLRAVVTDDSLGNLRQAPVLPHGERTHGFVGGALAEAALLHEDALGALDQLAFIECRASRVELCSNIIEAPRLRLYDLQKGAQRWGLMPVERK